MIPKGFVDPNLSPLESAKKESFEEAGITNYKGEISLGEVIIHKKIGSFKLDLYAGIVDRIVDVYPEMTSRRREWFPIDEAAEYVSNRQVGEMIRLLKTTNHPEVR